MKSRLAVVLFLVVSALFFGAVPAHAATAIDERYGSDSALRALLGSPVGTESSLAGGRLRHYQHGTLYWSPATGVHESHGAVLDAYRDAGGVQVLGFPLEDVEDVWVRFDTNVIGQEQQFSGGTVASSSAGSHVLPPAVAAEWLSDVPDLLMPTSDVEAVPGGSRVHFVTGTVYLTSAAAVSLFESLHGVQMRTTKVWGSHGGAWSDLGLPAGDLVIGSDLVSQQFEHGSVCWDGDFDAQEMAPDARLC